MDNTTYISLSRIQSLMNALEVTSQNLANANTAGYKSSHELFTDYLVRQKHIHDVPGERTEAYTQDRATYQDHAQGTFRKTDNLTDFAINGEGFFALRTPRGIRLTRNGRFQKRLDGSLTDQNGNALLDRFQHPIVLRNSDEILTVASDGTITTQDRTLGQINLVTVDNLYTLKPEEDNLLKPTTPIKNVAKRDIRQGMLEGSNVNMIDETTRLINIQRDYDLNFQMVQTESTRRLNAFDKITSQNND